MGAKTTTKRDKLQPEAVQNSRSDFPLTPRRASGQWRRKINGRTRYFGKHDDPDAAEKRYQAENDDWAAGRVPRFVEVITGRVDAASSCNGFLNARRRVDSGEIAERTWKGLRDSARLLTQEFGRDPPLSHLRGADFGRATAGFAQVQPTLMDIKAPRPPDRFRW